MFSKDTTGWHQAHHLTLDDPGVQNGSMLWCGSTCTRHVLYIESTVAQEVWVAAHTWDRRSYCDNCVDSSSKKHTIKMPHDHYHRTFKYGSHQLKPFQIAAGVPVEGITEWNFADPHNANDWSVTVWAKDGPVSIRRQDNVASQALPVIDRRTDIQEEPLPDPSAAPVFVPMHEDPLYIDFAQWVEEYAPDTHGYSCGAGVREDHILTTTGKMYQTVMQNTC